MTQHWHSNHSCCTSQAVARTQRSVQVMRFSVLAEQHKDVKPIRLFQLWFKDDYPACYELDKRESSPVKPSLRNKFKRQKEAVKALLLFLDNHPPARPTDVQELVEWEQNLAKMAEKSLRRAEQEITVREKNETKIKSVKQLRNLLKKHDVISGKSLPDDTPCDSVFRG